KHRLLLLPGTARIGTRALTAFTRHGAIAAGRRLSDSRVASPSRQLLMMLVGSALIGFGVSLFRASDLGVPPFDVLLSAIDRATILSHGQAAWFASGVLLGIAFVLGQRPRLTTLLFIVANGFAVDATAQLIVAPDALVMRMLLTTIGIAVIASGIAVVIHSGLTGGSFEMLTRAAESRGLPRTAFRLGLEVTVLSLGIVAGGDFGIATVIFALSIGKVMMILLQAMADHRTGRDARIDAEAASLR
ncbi:MAG: hypothetical protein OES57_06030, partial [Acidimicrobiia bacterium]|nr:hypothetical protein [Acidimicrobiia bacterium]